MTRIEKLAVVVFLFVSLVLTATLVRLVGGIGGGAADHGTNPSPARIWVFRTLDKFAIPL